MDLKNKGLTRLEIWKNVLSLIPTALMDSKVKIFYKGLTGFVNFNTCFLKETQSS